MADSELLLLLANSTQTLRITWTSDEDDEDGDGHPHEQVVDLVDQEEGVDRLELGFFGHPKQEHVDAEKIGAYSSGSFVRAFYGIHSLDER